MARKPFNPTLVRSAPDSERKTAVDNPITVSQVTAWVKRAIQDALPSTIHVVGEISNFKRHSSGHLYFTLKDRSCELSCVMWRSAADSLKFQPSDGLEVIATGAVEVFERAGRYQLYARKLQPRGIGALELAFRQLCEKLGDEGLFAEKHKKPLPPYPSRLAIVTSPTGAAIADMLRTLKRRYPCVDVFVYPVRVQGEGAAGEIARAIRRLNANAKALGNIDLMIVGRGGGSLEDLWAFNEEVVARAIYASRIPVISGVGHEVDVTIADLVADVRAAAPTAAAEMAVPDVAVLRGEFEAYAARLTRATRGHVALAGERVSALFNRAVLRQPLDQVRRREQVLDELVHRTYRHLLDRVRAQRTVLDGLEPIVQRIAPHALLLNRTVLLGDVEQRLDRAASRRFLAAQRTFEAVVRRLAHASPETQLPRLIERLYRVARTLNTSTRHRVSLEAQHVRRQEERLIAMGHRSVLSRGFSITRTKKGAEIVRTVKQLSDRQRVVTEVADGEFESEVVNLKQLELFD